MSRLPEDDKSLTGCKRCVQANDCTAEMLRLPNSGHAGSTIGPVASAAAPIDTTLDGFERYIPVSQ
jgi:hypothetical protein